MNIQAKATHDLKKFLLIKNQEGKKVRWRGKLWDPNRLLDELEKDTLLSRQLVMGRTITIIASRNRIRRRLAIFVAAGVVIAALVCLL